MAGVTTIEVAMNYPAVITTIPLILSRINPMKRPTFLLACALIGAAQSWAACLAQTVNAPQTALPPGQPLLAIDALDKPSWVNAPTEVIDVTGQSFARALRVRVPQTSGDTNRVQVTINTLAPVKKGDVLLATFAARGAATGGNAQLMLMFERNSAPYTKSVTQGVSLPAANAWRRVAIPFVAQEDYAAGAAMTSFRLAFGEQTIELADAQVRNFGGAVTLQKMREIAADMMPLGAFDVTVRATQTRQTMRGLGGNYTGGYRAGWGTPDDAVARYTRANLNPVHARLGLSLIDWNPRPGEPFNGDGKTGEVLKMAGEFAAKKIPLTVSIWEAPDWMTAQDGNKKIIPEAQWDAAINAIATFLERARERGALVENVSFNEPDLGIDIYWTPARMGAFIKRAVPEFKRRGLKALWLAGDTASGAGLVAYVRPQLEDEELRPMLGPISFHGWDALGASDQTYREIYQLAAKYDRPVWCLEAGSNAQAYKLRPSVWPTWDYALDVALAYAKTIGEARASVLDYWTYRDDFPLVDKENKPYPVYWVLRQFNEGFGAGTRIVEATTTSADARVLAGIRANGTTMVMLINPVGAGEVTLRGLEPRGQAEWIISFEKSQNIRVSSYLVTTPEGTLKVPLPARSVTLIETPVYYERMGSFISPAPVHPPVELPE